MGLLDEDSEIIKRNNAQNQSKKSGRKAKKSGLNRFANSLNKYKHLSEEHKRKAKLEISEPTKAEAVSSEAEELAVVKKQVNPTPTSDKAEKKASKPTPTMQKASPEKSEEPTEIEPIMEKASAKELEYETGENKSTERATLEYAIGNNQSTEQSTLEYELGNNKSTNRVHKGLQIGVQESPNLPLVRLLSGQKRQLLNLFFEDCKLQGSLTTGRLLNENLSKAMNVKPSTLKTIVYRLSKDGFIERLPGKRGRGGWIQIMIPKPVYDQILSLNSLSTAEMLNQNIEYKKSTEKVTQKSTTPSSSSSNFFENKTTTTSELSKIWQIVQIPQNLKDIGISTAHIIQIANDGFLSPDDVQNSLEAFAYDLEQGSVKARLGPLRLLLGVLRKQKVPYVSQAMIEQERRQLDEYMKKQEEAEQIKKQQAELGLVQKFAEWWSGLSLDERNHFVPPNNFFEAGSEMQERIARGKFLENSQIINRGS